MTTPSSVEQFLKDLTPAPAAGASATSEQPAPRLRSFAAIRPGLSFVTGVLAHCGGALHHLALSSPYLTASDPGPALAAILRAAGPASLASLELKGVLEDFSEPEDIEPLAALLEDTECNLHTLRLEFVDFSEGFGLQQGPDMMQRLAAALAANASLRELSFGHAKLSPQAAGLLADALAARRAPLTHLSVEETVGPATDGDAEGAQAPRTCRGAPQSDQPCFTCCARDKPVAGHRRC